jgi:23S rRNA pseudouridine2605 synthase
VKERLQKILARAGYGSRRSAETLIAGGRVTVNGIVVSTLGARADPEVDRVEVDGQPVQIEAPRTYLVMNKPYGYLTTAHDPQQRRTVMQLLPRGLPPHVLPVGRLDRDTEGLLIFTDDGDVAHRLAHPRFVIDKEYMAHVKGTPSPQAVAQLRKGVELDDRTTATAEVESTSPPHGFTVRAGHTWLRIVIHEGRKRQIRRMCAAVGHPVRTLVRTRVGDVVLGRLERGTTRRLTAREVARLRTAAGLDG